MDTTDIPTGDSLEYVDPDDYARRLNPGELGPLDPQEMF
jgi:hypothetical protein